ncbi:unnamed protein product [Angiostrongylus costaricensis]|uniref:Phorbol-ester/DAG-type domain-containing protein n=1 Tax=Angiostrongylus costaricensis TaxID=334426 RepID=A0A158PEJ6_ANGCS|nr:unnamed protein product [Angiostrongylus costaricensis]
MRSRGKEPNPAWSLSSPLPSALSSNLNFTPMTSPNRESLPCKLIYVHLPFDQHSRLEVRAGQTARDAISKLLKKRNITPQLCHVNVSEDPRSEQIDLMEDLESVASRLEKNELWVHSEYLDTVSSIKHTIVRRTFIPPVNCDVCKNPIWLVGYRCEFCQFKFHQRCSSFAPLYCDLIQTVPRDEALAQRLLLLASRMEGQDAEIAESVLNQLQPNSSPSHTPEGTEPEAAARFLKSNKPSSQYQSSVASNASSAGNGLAVRRPTNRLNPRADTSPFGSNSPSSTCSSPPATQLSAAQLLPPTLPLTPPQSAPPQKFSPGFFRGRSRSPEPHVEFEMSTILDIFKQITLGMNYLHSKSIIHRLYDISVRECEVLGFPVSLIVLCSDSVILFLKWAIMEKEVDEASSLCFAIQQMVQSSSQSKNGDIAYVVQLVKLIHRLFIVDLERAMEHGMDTLLWTTAKQLVDRVREESGNDRNSGHYDLCSHLYHCSLRAKPSLGDAWNQLGVLATVKVKPLDSLYFNTRALHCPTPFTPAAANISNLFRKYSDKGDTHDETRTRQILIQLLSLAFNSITNLLLNNNHLRPDLLLCIALLLRVPCACRNEPSLVAALSRSHQDVIFDSEKLETFRCFTESDPFEYPISYGQISEHIAELSERPNVTKLQCHDDYGALDTMALAPTSSIFRGGLYQVAWI